MGARIAPALPGSKNQRRLGILQIVAATEGAKPIRAGSILAMGSRSRSGARVGGDPTGMP